MQLTREGHVLNLCATLMDSDFIIITLSMVSIETSYNLTNQMREKRDFKNNGFLATL